MVSSLAQQLASTASLNTALLVDRSRRKNTESYLFTGRDADQHDLESIHALGTNGLLQLSTLNPALRPFEALLLSDAAKNMDRTLQPEQVVVELDKTIAAFLRILGPYLMEAPTGKVLEWLVRRFRINEFNVPDLLALFLPYHESPHFAKMVTILHIKEQTTWSFLLAYKQAGQSLPRIALVTEMIKNADVARVAVQLLPQALAGGYSHRTLLAFNAASLHDFIVRSKSLNEGTMVLLLPALIDPLTKKSSPRDAVLGSYVLLAALSQKCKLRPAALKEIIKAMAGAADRVTTHQFVNAVVSVCEPQDELDRWLPAAEQAIIRLPNIETELRKAVKWVGIEKFLGPLLSGLGRRLTEKAAESCLEALITTSTLPKVVLRRTTAILINQVVASDKDAPAARRLLALIQQRHSSVLNKAAEEIGLKDDETKDVVEQLLISLSMTYPSGAKANVDMVVASTSATPNVRVTAVKALLNALDNPDLASGEKESICSALEARVHDTNADVLEALYSKPELLVPLLAKDTQTYLNYVAGALSANPSRALLRAHARFIVQNIKGVDADVFDKIVYPFLLFSKKNKLAAKAVWEILDGQALGQYELLVGCVEVWKAQGQSGSVEEMSSTNFAVAAKIAENILASKSFTKHLDALLVKLHSKQPHARALAYLITRSLLGKLSGEQQIATGDKIVRAIGLEDMTGIDGLLYSSQSLEEFLQDASLGINVVSKPAGRHTLNWLQISVIAVIPSIARPQGVVLDWLAPSASKNAGAMYVGLMRSVYKLANSSGSIHILSTHLLRALFINLQDDSLALLAGVWTEDSEEHYRIGALRHASAFLQANGTSEKMVDFQNIVPSLVVALQTLDTFGRGAALECIDLVTQMSAKRPSSVYGFDSIHGDKSDQLQYLDWDDSRKYLAGMMEHRDHLASDPSYIKIFHQQHLAKAKADKKKDTEYKRRVLCYLLSHVAAIAHPVAQLTLLKTIEDVSDQVKAQLLDSTMLELINGPGAFGDDFEDFATLVVSSLDVSCTADLNKEDNTLWSTFLHVLRHYLQPDALLRPRAVLTSNLEHGVFAALKPERKVELVELVMAIGTQDTTAYSYCKKILASILEEVPIIIHLLSTLQPAPNSTAPRASKRAKVDGPAEETSESSLPNLSLLAEVLGTKPLPPSFDLIARLLETLHAVIQHVSPIQTDMSYIEQLLMSAIENAAGNIKEIPNTTPSSIRLDILVELIRVADNPQTFSQALMLMASLARLAPEAVLHNVMPVFTFMGSNVFHRDDAYSFRVVQKTVESIVPVMVSSLKKDHASQLDLYIGSRDFLRIFTDAANHIPRHRRTNFFSHLVDVLGPKDFLAPVCMLLIDKLANRVVRQSGADIPTTLALPIAVLHHYPAAVQHLVLAEVLRECQRLIARAVHPESAATPIFLEPSHDEEHALPASSSIKRRAQALITFVGHALKASPKEATDVVEGGSVRDLVSLLINLATAVGGLGPDAKIEDVNKAARTSMTHALGVMSVTNFVESVLIMVESGEPRVQVGALELLADRLDDVSDKMRLETAATIAKIIKLTPQFLASTAGPEITTASLKALTTIASTMAPGEESSLTALIPSLLARSRDFTELCMGVLSQFASKLGPRIIPHFRKIVTECVAIVRIDGQAPLVVERTLSVIHGLLGSIPTFWGSNELSLVVQLCLDGTVQQAGSMSTLMKVVAKRAPTKVLLPTLCDMWSKVKGVTQSKNNFGQYIAYFDLLKKALRTSSRPSVLEHLRPLFNMFLEAMDFSNVSAPSDNAEAHAISAFLELVQKLNEAVFRPLFRRLYDWAFTGEDNTAKKVTFCRIYMALLEFFKGLMSSYMSFLLQPFHDILKSFAKSTASDLELWTCVVQTLEKSFAVDEGAFWRDDKLRHIASPLIAQVGVCIRLNIPEGKTVLSDCLTAMVECILDESLLKIVNLDLLMNTRSEDSKLRVYTLSCAEALWTAHGGKLLGFVSETTTFIAECAEDENDSVAKEAHRLKDAVEAVAGNIAGI